MPNRLETTTIESYEQHVRLHMAPFLGRLKLSQTSVPLVREFHDKLRAGARSEAMVRRVLTSLSTMLGDSQERGLVARNVARDLRSRRKRGSQQAHEDRHTGRLRIGVDIPSPEEIRAFVAALQGRYRPVLLTAPFTGLRASELRGLRWCDVDLVRGELHVRQAG